MERFSKFGIPKAGGRTIANFNCSNPFEILGSKQKLWNNNYAIAPSEIFPALQKLEFIVDTTLLDPKIV